MPVGNICQTYTCNTSQSVDEFQHVNAAHVNAVSYEISLFLIAIYVVRSQVIWSSDSFFMLL